MITSATPIGQLIETARLLETPEHGTLQGIVIHGNGIGRVFYTWRTFDLNLAVPSPTPAPSTQHPAQTPR
jgi:hypothetical protein